MPSSEAFDDAGPGISSQGHRRNHPPRPCVLIADDEADLRIILADYLAHHGYEIVVAADGREALALVAACRLDVALVDVRMPGPSGMDLAAQLRALHPHLQVVIVTAYGSLEDGVEAIRSGAFHYLPKPLQPGQVLAVVEEALAARKTRAQLRARGSETDLKRADKTTLDEGASVRLNPRQVEVLRLIGRGMTNREIATELGLSPGTVGNYISAILRALGVCNRTAAVLRAQELDLL